MTVPRERPSSVQDHLERYLETNGRDGHESSGRPILLLTTTGRNSGKPSTTPLSYGRAGDRYLVVASRRGAPHHPDWYRNLVKTPDAEIQVLGDRFSVRARTATPEERPVLWGIMAKIWPAYDEYQTKITREIMVVVLERKV